MTVCNVKVAASNDEPTENHYLSLQFPSWLQSVLGSLSTLFWFCNFTFFD